MTKYVNDIITFYVEVCDEVVYYKCNNVGWGESKLGEEKLVRLCLLANSMTIDYIS